MLFFKGLHQKIYLTLAGLSFFFGLALLLFVKFEYSKQLRGELEKRGISIARHLAQHSIGHILARDALTIKLEAIQAQKAEEDIIYIFFGGQRDSDIFAHTFGAEFPIELLDANYLPAHNDYSIAHLETEVGRIYDVAVPIGRGNLGQVHVGMSGQPITAAVNRLTWNILLVTLALAAASLLLCLPLSAAIVRPLNDLNHAAREVAAGRFEQHLNEQQRDEIGELAQSFNFMTRQLQATQQELLTRNRLLVDEVERRQSAEENLASQLKFIATLMNELPEPVFYKNTQGVYLGCNRAYEEFNGLPREKIIGHGSHDLFPKTEAEIHVQADNDLFNNPGTCQYELPVTAAKSHQRQVVCKKTTFVNSAGLLAGLVGIMIDVTAERRIDKLRQEFVSTTAHEFQTPLAAILGFCELLQTPTNEITGNQDEFVSIIKERAEFLSRLVDQFLDVSRIEAGRNLPLTPAPCHIQSLIQRLLRNQQGHQHRFEIRFPADSPPVLADEDRIAQVIENLISNAVKYSPPQGRIIITGTQEDNMLHISIEDQGVGLSEDELDHIFDKFYRADTSETAPSGTGLGLYISRAIVKSHGGQISASSQPGQGATFTFTLPLTTPPTSEPHSC